MNEDQFNMNIRKFLKTVGITSQREIETAVRGALEDGSIDGNETLDVKVKLSIGALNVDTAIDGKISPE